MPQASCLLPASPLLVVSPASDRVTGDIVTAVGALSPDAAMRSQPIASSAVRSAFDIELIAPEKEMLLNASFPAPAPQSPASPLEVLNGSKLVVPLLIEK